MDIWPWFDDEENTWLQWCYGIRNELKRNPNIKIGTVADYNNSIHNLKKRAVKILLEKTDDNKFDNELEINLYALFPKHKYKKVFNCYRLDEWYIYR